MHHNDNPLEWRNFTDKFSEMLEQSSSPTQKSFKISTLVILYLIIFLGSAGYFMTIPAYVDLFISKTNHAMIHNAMSLAHRRELFGIVMSLAPFISMFFTPFFARLSDVYGRKPFMLLALVIAGLGFFLPIVAIGISSILLLFLGNMLNSLGSASQPIAQACLTEMSDGKRKAVLLSLIAVVLTLAMAFAPALGSKLLSLYGPKAPFYACLTIVIACFVLLSLFVSPKEIQHQHAKPTKIDWKAPIKRSRKGLLPALGIVFCTQFGWSLYFQNLSFLLPEKWHIAIESSIYQEYMMGIGLSMIVALLLLPSWLLKKAPLTRCLQGSLIVACGGMILLAFCPTALSQALLLIPVVAAIALAFPFYMTRVSENAEGQDQATAMALASALIGLAWTLSGYLTAVFANIGLDVPIIIGSISIFVSLCLTPRTKLTQQEGITA